MNAAELENLKEGDGICLNGEVVCYFDHYDTDGTPVVLCMDGALRRLEKEGE